MRWLLLAAFLLAPTVALADESASFQRAQGAYLTLQVDQSHFAEDMTRLREAVIAAAAENAQLAAQIAWWQDPANRAWVDGKGH